jgi:glyoxylase-like metal-dependent hydrolase (beta-lactamase superfamily II)
MIAAGGHTPGSTVFLARLQGETWIFSGDLTNSLAEVREDRGKGWLYSYLLVPENVTQLARWRNWLRAVGNSRNHVVVSHDLASYRDNGLLPWQGEP